MEFTLYYRGPLKAASTKNKRKPEKHALRKHFHGQLRELWNQTPLNDHREFLAPSHTPITGIRSDADDIVFMGEDADQSLICEVGEFQFAPTVSDRLHMVADLTKTLLRPEPPGRIVTQGGDIDNRLKTLLDALKVPRQPDDLPDAAAPSEGESPFFCLVSDDNLITNLDIKTDRLLDPSAEASEVVLLIHVRTRLLKGTFPPHRQLWGR